MSDTRRLRAASLGALFERLRAAGWRIIGPRASGDTVTFGEVASPEDLATDIVQTTLSPKDVVLPMWEELFRFAKDPSGIRLSDRPVPATPTLVWGVRPCDARALSALDAIFTWDFQDEPYLARRGALTLVGVACTEADDWCFCTSTGGGPGDPTGSDLFLTPIEEGFLVEALSDRGRGIESAAEELFEPVDRADVVVRLADVPVRFDHKRLEPILKEAFDKEELWRAQSLRCLGCGACAYVCPTCACFDIQDEATRHGGARVRCWDSCGFSLFTLHASGHNPREVQSARWRQRIMHKFSYMPQRLSVLGCVGCGRCSRACPVDMNLAEHLSALVEGVA